jgi:hypothetical protein
MFVIYTTFFDLIVRAKQTAFTTMANSVSTRIKNSLSTRKQQRVSTTKSLFADVDPLRIVDLSELKRSCYNCFDLTNELVKRTGKLLVKRMMFVRNTSLSHSLVRFMKTIRKLRSRYHNGKKQLLLYQVFTMQMDLKTV